MFVVCISTTGAVVQGSHPSASYKSAQNIIKIKKLKILQNVETVLECFSILKKINAKVQFNTFHLPHFLCQKTNKCMILFCYIVTFFLLFFFLQFLNMDLLIFWIYSQTLCIFHFFQCDPNMLWSLQTFNKSCQCHTQPCPSRTEGNCFPDHFTQNTQRFFKILSKW